MADFSRIHPENVPGPYFVDSHCIDCDACRVLAPDHFHRSSGQSVVGHQPRGAAQTTQVLGALFACPTASIGSRPGSGRETGVDRGGVAAGFPKLLEANVYYCGFHDNSTYGAASYFIRHPRGNILIDTPRPAGPLIKNLHQLGGVRYHFMTHIDDVGQHEKFHQEFHTTRIIHKRDGDRTTSDFEMVLDIQSPIDLTQGIKIIPTPGHSPGHMVLLYQNRVLFTGDHLAWSPRLEHLYAFRRYCWYSWEEQIRSMERLFDFSFTSVLPGHGRRYQIAQSERESILNQCLEWMRKVA